MIVSLLFPLSGSADPNNIKPAIRTLKSASEFDYPPFCLVKKDGSADGFSVELLKTVTQIVGLDIRFDVAAWNDIKQKLIDGQIEVLPFVSYSKERDEVLDFTAPYLRLHGTIFVRKGETSIHTETDLKEKEVLVMRGDTAHEYAVKRNISNHLILTDSFEQAMMQLSSGKHDAVIIQQLAGIQLIKQLNISNIVDVDSFQDTNIKIKENPLEGFEQKFCIAVKEGDKELLARLNEGLAIVIANGTYDDLYNKWFSPILPPPPVNVIMIAKYIFLILLPVLFILGIIGIWLLKREVALKTEKLMAQIEITEKSRDLVDRIMETSPVGITRVDADGKLLYANKRAEKILGIRFSEDAHKPYDDPTWRITDFYGKSFPVETLPFNLVKKTQKPVYDIRHAIKWPDDRQVFLSINASPLFDGSKEFDGIVASIEDITEKYKAEQDYKMLFREMLDGFALHEILWDDSGNPINYRFLAINPAFERLTGLRGDSLIGNTILEIMPQTESYWIETYGRVALTGEPETFERYSRELNRYFQVTAFRYAKNQFACIFADITQRKSAEAERNKLIEAIRQAGESIVITSPDGRIQYVNPAFEKMTGYSKQTALDKTPRFLKSGVQDTRFYQDLWNTILSGNRWTGQLVNKNKAGELYTSGCSISPVKDENGKITNFIWIAKNITRQIAFEKRMSQAQKMESIGTLAGGIAHDFNNILFPIVGHTEMLLEDIPEDSPLRDSLDEIYIGSLRAKELVKQILAFSRQEKTELKLMKMQPIIKEALKLIRSTIPTTISINQNLQSDCGAVIADPTQIHQIIMNLTTNAYHVMEETGGEITVSLKEINLGYDKLITPDMTAGSYACLSVTDTGMGMDKKTIDKIFEPFFTTKERGKGTGMGLSVVHGIVKSMNGAIQVYSEPDKGTQFHVYLPVVKTRSTKEETRANEPIPGGTERILLVDDETGIITMVKQALERIGYQVTSCTGSIEALEAFKVNPDKYHLVISDMTMPNMSGDKLAVELIKIRPEIPILLCTGFSESMSEEKIKSLGIKGLLLKPIIMMDLAKKIRDILDKPEKKD